MRTLVEYYILVFEYYENYLYLQGLIYTNIDD